MFKFKRRKPEIYLTGATGEDSGHLAEIHRTSFSRPWSDGEFENMLATRGTFALIARIRGRIDQPPIGFVLVRSAADEAEIISIATLPGSRRNGIARALMDQVIRDLHSERIGRLLLEVDGSNRPALALYRSLGFRQISVRQGYYQSLSEQVTGEQQANSDALVMELDLR